MMSTKPEQIDLNAEAVSVDRENEGHLPVVGVSVAETLTESIDGQGQLQDSLVDKIRVSDSAEVICNLKIGGVDVNMSSESVEGKVESENLDRGVNAKAGKVVCDLNIGGDDVNTSSEDIDREGDVLDKVIDLETGNEALDGGVDLNTEETVGRFGNDVGTFNENGVVAAHVAERGSGNVEMDQDLNVDLAHIVVNSSSIYGDTGQSPPHESAQVAERASGDAEMDQDINVGLVRDELEQGTYVMKNSSSFDGDRSQSLPHKSARGAERASGEIEMDKNVNVSLVRKEVKERNSVTMNLTSLNQDTSHSLQRKFKATSDDTEKQAMKLDTQVETSENQLVNIHVSDVRTDSDALNELCMVNLVVDLNPFKTTNGKVPGNVKTGLVSSKPEFHASDLVWGKVRSHPWWPGQIFDPSDAAQKATKYFKKDSYLIAYFGDQTFAWNEVSKIKHFREHFAQMENQSNLEDFHYAIDCTLEEISRRVEYGLACSCIPEEAFAKIKTQIIVNAGIREESSMRDGGDRFSDAVSFDPIKLFEKIKALAQLPYSDGFDRLEFVTIKAQLSAFYRWKGYLQLPEFDMLGGLLESDAEIPLSVEVEHIAEVTQNAAPYLKDNKQVSPGMGKLKSQDGSSHKRKHTSGDNIHSRKKEKTLSDLLAERYTNLSNGKGNKLIASSSGKKRKVAISMADDLAVKHKRSDSDSDDMDVKHKKLDSISNVVTVKAVEHGRSDLSIKAANKCLPSKKTFGVGSSILKVASQLNGTNLLFKCGDRTAENTTEKNKIKEKSLSRKSQSKKLFPIPAEESSPEELLSQLCLAAQDPMKGYNFSSALISFLSEFRNSFSLDKQSLEEVYGDKSGKTLTKSETTETSELELKNDCYWTDRVVESTPEEQQSLGNKSEAGELLHENPSPMDMSANLESGPQIVDESLGLEVQPVDSLDGCRNEDPSPTALILNFTDLDSVPSKENLNKIFSRFGSLNELETEVLKSKRAKVVFKRRADAEMAFSSAGKYSIFGPSLVSYCLKYMSSASNKASSNATKRRRKAATFEE